MGGSAGSSGIAMYIPINMQTNKIIDCSDPTNPQDVATKNYVDTQNANYLLKAGDTMTGDLSFSGTDVKILANNIGDTKRFVIGTNETSSYISFDKSGGNITCTIRANSFKYINSTGKRSLFYSIASTIIYGTLDLDSNKIVNVLDPTNPQDVATKNYVDTHNLGGVQ